MRLTILVTAAIVAALPSLSPGRDAIWDTDYQLTTNSFTEWCYWGGQHRVASAPDGRIHAVWYARAVPTDSFAIHYMRYNPGVGWSNDTVISADLANNQNKYASVAVDSNNVVWVVWASLNGSSSTIYAKSCVPSGTGNDGWDATSTMLSVAAPTDDKDCPTVAASPDGNVHVSWIEENRTIKYCEHIPGGWLPEQIAATGSLYKVYPVIAAGRDNNLHIAFHGYFASGNTYYNVMCVSRLARTWQTPENVSSAARHQMYPSIAVSPVTNQPHVVWRGYAASGSGTQYRTMYSCRTGSGWAARETLSEYGSTISQGAPQVACTPDGLVHVVWPGQYTGMGKTELLYRERDTAGVWQPYVMLTDTVGIREYPSVCADAASGVHVTWLDYRSTPAEMYYKHGSPATGFASGSPLPPVAPSFTIAPNPLRSGVLSVFIPSSHISHPSALSFLDASGRCVVARALAPAAAGTLSVDLRGLAAGVYLVRLTDNTTTVSRKLVIEK
jgi:hypothetical protein